MVAGTSLAHSWRWLGDPRNGPCCRIRRVGLPAMEGSTAAVGERGRPAPIPGTVMTNWARHKTPAPRAPPGDGGAQPGGEGPRQGGSPHAIPTRQDDGLSPAAWGTEGPACAIWAAANLGTGPPGKKEGAVGQAQAPRRSASGPWWPAPRPCRADSAEHSGPNSSETGTRLRGRCGPSVNPTQVSGHLNKTADRAQSRGGVLHGARVTRNCRTREVEDNVPQPQDTPRVVKDRQGLCRGEAAATKGVGGRALRAINRVPTPSASRRAFDHKGSAVEVTRGRGPRKTQPPLGAPCKTHGPDLSVGKPNRARRRPTRPGRSPGAKAQGAAQAEDLPAGRRPGEEEGPGPRGHARTAGPKAGGRGPDGRAGVTMVARSNVPAGRTRARGGRMKSETPSTHPRQLRRERRGRWAGGTGTTKRRTEPRKWLPLLWTTATAHGPQPCPPEGPAHRWEGVPPEWTLSGSVVVAEAKDRLEPDWARLRLSAARDQRREMLVRHSCGLAGPGAGGPPCGHTSHGPATSARP